MKKRLKKQLNKNLKMILVIGIVVVLAMGALLVLISGNDEKRDQVPIDPDSKQQEEEKDRKDRKVAESNDHPGVSDVALDMYNARVDDISDPAQVAQLVEASDMREELGDYLVTLKVKGDVKTLIITFDKQLLEGEDAVFNETATWYAEQFLALIEQAEEIKWVYKIEKSASPSSEAKEETDKDSKSDQSESKNKISEVEKSLTLEQANELLDKDIKSYSESPELVQTLLNNQKGIV